MIVQWATRWQIPHQAVTELMALMGASGEQVGAAGPGVSETAVQQQIRLDASRAGVRLWRNNRGAAYDKDGRMTRYGLANDSAALNKRLKSSDLIGITPHHVTAGDVGQTMGIFTSIEVKRGGWKYSGTPRELAQLAWIKLVVSLGGIAKFAASREDWR